MGRVIGLDEVNWKLVVQLDNRTVVMPAWPNGVSVVVGSHVNIHPGDVVTLATIDTATPANAGDGDGDGKVVVVSIEDAFKDLVRDRDSQDTITPCCVDKSAFEKLGLTSPRNLLWLKFLSARS